MMDVNLILKNVANLDEYITATHEVLSMRKNLKVSINTDTILTLRKIRSLEIEYLNKCSENGAACILLERLLTLPPSQAWGILAKELVILLHYWLEAIRKHLIKHCAHWWIFLKLVMQFTKDLRVKDTAIPNMVVERTAECWLALATDSKPDVYQKHEIVHSFNTICAESGREIRFILRNKLTEYFVKIAAHVVTSGYLPAQFSMLECLMRWVVPRQDSSQRAAAFEKWQLADLCPAAARDLFLNSNWANFYQDSRNFINALNEESGLVRSMICRQLTIGKTVLINGTEKEQSWLDFNTLGKSVSVLLVSKMMERIGLRSHQASQFLVIDGYITKTAQLRKEPLGPTISLSMLRAPSIRPLDISASDELVTIVLSSRSNLRVLDKAMRDTFGEKYQPITNVDTDISLSPQRFNKVKIDNQSEEDSRFSNPAEVKRKKHSGYLLKSKKPLSGVGSHASSTESTSSLLQLRDKLTALPWVKFDRCQPSACAKPSLSHVSELTEVDNCSLPATTRGSSTDTKCRSEGDIFKHTGNNRTTSSAIDVDSEPIYYSAAAVSAFDCKLKKTKSRISKPEDCRGDSIVDLLLHEAFEAENRKKTLSQEAFDTGVNILDNKSQEKCDDIDDTSNEVDTRNNIFNPVKKCTVVSKTTTDDESNTEAIINETQFVKPIKNRKQRSAEVQNIEEFFSQHVIENVTAEMVIEPSLARKNNETSSEISEHFDDNLLMLNEDVNSDVEQSMFNDIEVIDCLNDMVDKVCSKFDKCTEYLYKKDIATMNENKSELFKDNVTSKAKAVSQKKNNNKTLKNKPGPKVKERAAKKIKKVAKEVTKKMSTIIEQKENDTIIEETRVNTQNNNDVLQTQNSKKITETVETTKVTVTPTLRRKRKLYSPKDDVLNDKFLAHGKESSDDVLLSELVIRNSKTTPKTTATCYKELEKERGKYSRLSRNRKSKALDAPSPRTLKMDSVFDNLKQTVESNEKITLVDKNADVFNFTSDSEDEDFVEKKNIISKRLCSSVNSVVKQRKNTRRARETESSCDEGKKSKVVKRKNTKRLTRKTAKITNELEKETIDLADERMREANKDMLNTSVIVENPIDLEPECLVPVIQAPVMEEIYDSDKGPLVLKKNKLQSKKHQSNVSKIKNIPKENTLIPSDESNEAFAKKVYPKTKTTKVESHDEKSNHTAVSKKKNKLAKKTEFLAIKKEKYSSNKTKTLDKDNDGTMSPLPGLLVESMPKRKEDVNDSLTTNMLNKFKRIHRDGPDVNDSVLTQNMLSDVEKINYSAQNCTFTDGMFDLDMRPKDIGKKSQQDKENAKEAINAIAIMEMFDAIDANDNLSDISITSDGIRAHGDLDEKPPSTKTIKESHEPREIHDLDASMIDYFTKLNREINKSSKECSQNVDKVIKTMSQVHTSPVVSVKRLSNYDINRWMPSRRTSECSLHSSPDVSHCAEVRNTTKSENIPKSKQTIPDTLSPKSDSKSPTVVLSRMSLEEFNKWLPIPDSFENKNISREKSGNVKLIYGTRSQSRARNVEESIKKSTCTEVKADHTRIINTRSSNAKSNSRKVIESKDAVKSDATNKNKSHNLKLNKDKTFQKLEINIKRTGSSENATSIVRTKDTNAVKPYDVTGLATKQGVKPMISPIKILANIESRFNADRNTRIDSKQDSIISLRSAESEVQALKQISDNIPSEPKKMRFKEPTSSHMAAHVDDSEDEPVIYERLQPKIVLRDKTQGKDVALAESSRSVSSVKEWLMRCDFTGKAAPMSHRDAIQNIMEKVDTTLVETNQNTSKMFVSLFMETQNRLKLQKAKESELNKQFAAELNIEIASEAKEILARATRALSEMVVRITERKFAELHRVSQDARTEFMESLKKQVFEAIREDCKRKRAMITMLKEDVLAISDHINKMERSDSQ